MKYFFVIFLSLMTSFSWAAGDSGIFDRGNGGDVVICKLPDGKKTYQVLDLYEQLDRGYTPRRYSSNLSYMDIIHQEIARIEQHFPKVAKHLTVELSKLQASLYFKEDYQVPEIQDENIYHSLPCKVRQLAVQWTENSPYGRVYWINARYFPRLDARNKAALILHELVYRLFVSNFPKEELNSRPVRQYVGLFMSEEFDQLAPGMFQNGLMIYQRYF